ncbi:MAG: hypothetical protein ABDH28_06660 [Brevinematia bacterium]
MNNQKSKSLLDLVFEEKVIVYALLPFLISFSFFGILVEVAKVLSNYNSPYFNWYPIYFLFIIPFSIYTNSSIFAGGKFLRSIIETIFEIFLLLLFNFIFLKGFSLGKNINEFLDISFGISVAFWIALRIINGHIVRLTNLPYEILTTTANSIASGINIEEIFDEKYFEKHSIRKSIKTLVITFSSMLVLFSIALILSGSTLLTSIYTILFVVSCIMLLLNVAKAYVLEDSIIKKINIGNIDFMNKLVKFSLVSTILITLVSLILSVGIYFGASEISKIANLALRDKINEIISQERKVSEEEIKRIRERLMAKDITNENLVATPKPERKVRRGIDWLIILFFIQYLLLILATIIIIGFILKKVFKVKDIPVLGFFVKVYEIFAYFVGNFFRSLFDILRRLFFVRKRAYIPKEIEEEIMASMHIHKEEVSKEKIEEIETIVKIFINMLSYTSYIFPYKKSMGVEEYCTGLKSFIPEFSNHLEFISDIVNESRYSNHLLPHTAIEELKERVQNIISKVRIKVKVVEDFRGG